LDWKEKNLATMSKTKYAGTCFFAYVKPNHNYDKSICVLVVVDAANPNETAPWTYHYLTLDNATLAK
jgi:hypothetical protein